MREYCCATCKWLDEIDDKCSALADTVVPPTAAEMWVAQGEQERVEALMRLEE